MIRAGELNAFVGDMYEQMNDRAMWEFFVGKVEGRAYGQWRAEELAKAATARRDAPARAAADIIADSLAISSMASAEEVAGQ